MSMTPTAPISRSCSCMGTAAGRRSRMTGWLAIAGLGPGDELLVTPEVTAALAEATDVLGYVPYVARIRAARRA